MAADARLICSSGELVDGGPGVRFTVHRHDGDEQAFAVRFRGRAAAYINRCGHVPIELTCRSSWTGSPDNSSMIPSYT